jgi:hypothetical protein
MFEHVECHIFQYATPRAVRSNPRGAERLSNEKAHKAGLSLSVRSGRPAPLSARREILARFFSTCRFFANRLDIGPRKFHSIFKHASLYFQHSFCMSCTAIFSFFHVLRSSLIWRFPRVDLWRGMSPNSALACSHHAEESSFQTC